MFQVRKMAAIVRAAKGNKEIRGEFDVIADCAGNLLYAMQAGDSSMNYFLLNLYN